MPAHLHTLAKRYPNVPAALAELANLNAILTLPKPTVHVVSDVHGEYVKLRQVINNASGSLRPCVDRLFTALTDSERNELLAFFYYPRETWLKYTRGKPEAERRAKLLWFVPHAVTMVHDLARHYTLRHVDKIIPDPFDSVFHELMFAAELSRQPRFLERILEPFVRHDRDLDLVRMLSRTVRNLAVGELVVAGDLGDRGPRIDKVIDLLIQQPKVSVTWGNHDTVWMAACLGHAASIMTVIRVSLRYRRLSQLEEGYGIAMAPLERLAREVYGEDPAVRFKCKGEGLRDDQIMARMQKAAAIMQFKLEGQLFQRRADWGMAHRALLHRIDPVAGTVDLGDAGTHPMLDLALPTIDWADPYKLTAAEDKCLARLTKAFVESGTMWKQMTFVASRGRMALRRDNCSIFHGCMPVDEHGELQELVIDGTPRKGKALFDAVDLVVQRAFRKQRQDDVDMLFYLWTGPVSPCFGKDRMATFETYFVADKATHTETKNPYFKLIHDAAFCGRILRELGVVETGFLVNGHVPVKLEKGETPIKASKHAITIDGAFAAAYGDKGFSLVLDAHRMYLAQHHHFEGSEAVIEAGADIVPTVSDVEVYATPRTVGDTEAGDAIRSEIETLEELVAAFETNLIRPTL
ncbi:MAG: fructose-bisphosphatase class III [Kofleriaceae bacterium]